jgi:hypothetical protein
MTNNNYDKKTELAKEINGDFKENCFFVSFVNDIHITRKTDVSLYNGL